MQNDSKYPQLQLNKAANCFQSFDGAKLTSTIVNIDIEEVCFCLACAIQKHIEYYEKSFEEGLVDQYSDAFGKEAQELKEATTISPE